MPWPHGSRRSARRVAIASIFAASSAVAQQHAPPRACTLSAPATILGIDDSPTIAAVRSEGPPTLWVLYSAPDSAHPGQRTATVLQLSNVDSRRPEIHLWAVGSGDTRGPAITWSSTGVVAAFDAGTQGVGVFVHPAQGGNDRIQFIASPSEPAGIALAAVRNGGVVTWTEANGTLHSAQIDLNGVPVGTPRALRGHYANPAALSAFGGVVLATTHEATARLAIARRTATAALHAFGPAARAAVSSIGGATGTWGSLIAYIDTGRAYLATLASAAGAGTHRDLGDASEVHVPARVAVGATQWGAVAVWTNDGIVMAAASSTTGSPVGSPMPLIDPTHTERAHAVAVAGGSDGAIVVWSATGVQGEHSRALRMVRVVCQ